MFARHPSPPPPLPANSMNAASYTQHHQPQLLSQTQPLPPHHHAHAQHLPPHPPPPQQQHQMQLQPSMPFSQTLPPHNRLYPASSPSSMQQQVQPHAFAMPMSNSASSAVAGPSPIGMNSSYANPIHQSSSFSSTAPPSFVASFPHSSTLPPNTNNSESMQLINSIFDEILAELVNDICSLFHRQEKTSLFNLARYGEDGETDIFGVSLRKQQDASFPCEICNRTIGSLKYAAHLEKCFGKGRNGRNANRRRNAAQSAMSPELGSPNHIAPTPNSFVDYNDSVDDDSPMPAIPALLSTTSSSSASSSAAAYRIPMVNQGGFTNPSSGVNMNASGNGMMRNSMMTAQSANFSPPPAHGLYGHSASPLQNPTTGNRSNSSNYMPPQHMPGYYPSSNPSSSMPTSVNPMLNQQQQQQQQQLQNPLPPYRSNSFNERVIGERSNSFHERVTSESSSIYPSSFNSSQMPPMLMQQQLSQSQSPSPSSAHSQQQHMMTQHSSLSSSSSLHSKYGHSNINSSTNSSMPQQRYDMPSNMQQQQQQPPVPMLLNGQKLSMGSGSSRDRGNSPAPMMSGYASGPLPSSSKRMMEEQNQPYASQQSQPPHPLMLANGMMSPPQQQHYARLNNGVPSPHLSSQQSQQLQPVPPLNKTQALVTKAASASKSSQKSKDVWWHEELPLELPTSAKQGGQPHFVKFEDAASCGTPPSKKQLEFMLEKICGSIAANSSNTKLCCNKRLHCNSHSASAKQDIRSKVLNEEIIIRIKKTSKKS